MYKTIISANELARHLGDPGWVIVDCRFSLADSEAGRRTYLQAHIPTAVYAHLDDDLSGPPVTDHGRHPLPTASALTATFARLGIGHQTQVVAYDDAGGMVAGRLWWLLRYMGHERVALLDGGWPAWVGGDRPVRSGSEANTPGKFTGKARAEMLVQLADVAGVRPLIDSRAPERFRGDLEPLDPRPGHIPGAHNYYYQQNLDEKGLLKSGPQLRQQFSELLGPEYSAKTTFYCGSGVSACLNLVALEHAGLPLARLYVGSWSEWCADPDRPAALGEAAG